MRFVPKAWVVLTVVCLWGQGCASTSWLGRRQSTPAAATSANSKASWWSRSVKLPAPEGSASPAAARAKPAATNVPVRTAHSVATGGSAASPATARKPAAPTVGAERGGSADAEGSFFRSLMFWRKSDSTPRPAEAPARSDDPVKATPKPAVAATGRTVVPASGEAPDGMVDGEPRLKPGLIVKVTVMAGGKKEVEEEAKRVSSSGIITLPLLGSVPVNGLTMDEFTALLKKLYSEYLQDPIVDAEFAMEEGKEALSPWGYVTVLGRVKEPGRVNIPPTRDLSLSMAVQRAGGLDTSAKLKGIKITRNSAKGKQQQFEVDLESVGADGKVEKDVKLEPGDVVFVPESVF